MYYGLVIYPDLEHVLAESIDAIRSDYDPTFGIMGSHITVVFPVPESVGESRLTTHIGSVLAGWPSFEISLSGCKKSDDHWLFLLLRQGDTEVRRLYRALYTGILDEYRRDDIEFTPHLAVGLFLKPGVTYDWDHPQKADFDELRCATARQRVAALPLGSRYKVDRLHLVAIPDEIIEWATGSRVTIPDGIQVVERREFILG